MRHLSSLTICCSAILLFSLQPIVAKALLPVFGGSAGVWVIGMRYKILDATTTEQVAQGYTEEKMEIGAKSTSVGGISSAAAGGVSLDTMVQRLVQKSVWDIDFKHK